MKFHFDLTKHKTLNKKVPKICDYKYGYLYFDIHGIQENSFHNKMIAFIVFYLEVGLFTLKLSLLQCLLCAELPARRHQAEANQVYPVDGTIQRGLSLSTATQNVQFHYCVDLFQSELH